MNQLDALKVTQSDVVRQIEAFLRGAGASTGMKADLRRMNALTDITNSSLHRILAMYVPEQWVRTEDSLRRWALIVHVAAYQAKIETERVLSVGEAAYKSGMKEARLTAFLRSEGRGLFGAIGRFAKFSGSAGVRANLPELAQYILWANDRSRRDSICARIAENFYRAEAASQKTQSTEPTA